MICEKCRSHIRDPYDSLRVMTTLMVTFINIEYREMRKRTRLSYMEPIPFWEHLKGCLACNKRTAILLCEGASVDPDKGV